MVLNSSPSVFSHELQDSNLSCSVLLYTQPIHLRDGLSTRILAFHDGLVLHLLFCIRPSGGGQGRGVEIHQKCANLVETKDKDPVLRRACDRCHAQKTSCEREQNGPCTRCVKANITCVSSPSLRNRRSRRGNRLGSAGPRAVEVRSGRFHCLVAGRQGRRYLRGT